MNATRQHVARRYQQAEEAFRSLSAQPSGMSLFEFAAALRAPERQTYLREKAEQMTRIMRRAQRMLRGAL